MISAGYGNNQDQGLTGKIDRKARVTRRSENQKASPRCQSIQGVADKLQPLFNWTVLNLL